MRGLPVVQRLTYNRWNEIGRACIRCAVLRSVVSEFGLSDEGHVLAWPEVQDLQSLVTRLECVQGTAGNVYGRARFNHSWTEVHAPFEHEDNLVMIMCVELDLRVRLVEKLDQLWRSIRTHLADAKSSSEFGLN